MSGTIAGQREDLRALIVNAREASEQLDAHPGHHQRRHRATRPELVRQAAGADRQARQHAGQAGFGRRQRQRHPRREPRRHQQLRQRRPGPARPDPGRTARPGARPAPHQRPPRQTTPPATCSAATHPRSSNRNERHDRTASRARAVPRPSRPLVLAGLLAGCLRLLGGEQARPGHHLRARPARAGRPGVAGGGLAAVDRQRPTAARMIDSLRIAVRPDAGDCRSTRARSWAKRPDRHVRGRAAARAGGLRQDPGGGAPGQRHRRRLQAGAWTCAASRPTTRGGVAAGGDDRSQRQAAARAATSAWSRAARSCRPSRRSTAAIPDVRGEPSSSALAAVTGRHRRLDAEPAARARRRAAARFSAARVAAHQASSNARQRSGGRSG